MTAARAFDGDDLRKTDPKFQQPRLEPVPRRGRGAGALARERYGKSVLALAVRWILDQGGTIALWGARRPEQLAPVDERIGWSLDAAAMREIDRILTSDDPDPVGPEFMAPPLRAAA